jgi:ankyrin repeat protein
MLPPAVGPIEMDQLKPWQRRAVKAGVLVGFICVISLFIHTVGWVIWANISLPPLHKAAKKGDTKKIDRLLSQGAEINALDDNYKWSPLMFAVVHREPAAVSTLLELGADANFRDSHDGETPLHAAISRKGASADIKIAKLLLERGALVDAQTRAGYTALNLIFPDKEKEVNAAKLLIEFGANPNGGNTDTNYTPLHHSVYFGVYELVELYLSKGADVNPKNHLGETPLDIAYKQKHHDIIVLLKKHGAITNKWK